MAEKGVDGGRSFATLVCEIGEREVFFDISVSDGGVSLCAKGDGEVALMLPAFVFDGEERSEISRHENTLEVRYREYTCKYSSSGAIYDTERVGCNRNGHYALFYTKEKREVKVEILIE